MENRGTTVFFSSKVFFSKNCYVQHLLNKIQIVSLLHKLICPNDVFISNSISFNISAKIHLILMRLTKQDYKLSSCPCLSNYNLALRVTNRRY